MSSNITAMGSNTVAPTIPPELFLTQMAFGALMTQALYVVAKIGVADLLADAPKPVSELATRTKTHEQALYRVMRSLASNGIFRETEPRVFALTPYAQLLRDDAPNSMRDGVIFMGEAWHWEVWGNLLHSVQTGKPAWEQTHGAEVFDYFTTHPEAAEVFNAAMTAMSVSTAPVIIEAYDFSDTKTLCDVAGGHGYLLAQILKKHPQMKGILFDMPSVIESADALLGREAVKDRVECVTGSFFTKIPVGADAYIMKHIIHDWDDERCVQILKNIHRAIGEQGKLLIVECVVPEGNDPHYAKLLDLEMLASPGGVERTAKEYTHLLAASNFTLTRIIPTASPFSIIEAVKVG